jgi:hypothetical protein
MFWLSLLSIHYAYDCYNIYHHYYYTYYHCYLTASITAATLS